MLVGKDRVFLGQVEYRAFVLLNVFRRRPRLLIEVFEVTTDGRPVAEPADGLAPAGPQRELGAFTKAVLG